MAFATGTLFLSLAVSAALSGVSIGLQFLLRQNPKEQEFAASPYTLSEIGTPIPVNYGRCVANGIVAFADEQSPSALGSSQRNTIRDAINDLNQYPFGWLTFKPRNRKSPMNIPQVKDRDDFDTEKKREFQMSQHVLVCLLYTSPSPRDS